MEVVPAVEAGCMTADDALLLRNGNNKGQLRRSDNHKQHTNMESFYGVAKAIIYHSTTLQNQKPRIMHPHLNISMQGSSGYMICSEVGALAGSGDAKSTVSISLRHKLTILDAFHSSKISRHEN